MAKHTFSNESTFRKFLEQGKEDEFHSLFDNAVQEARREFGKAHGIYIGGKEVREGSTITEKSPINGEIIGTFQRANREQAKKAIKAAKDASHSWSATSYKDRARMFNKAADTFSKHKFNISAILSYENGKSRYESVGEVDEAIDFLRYYSNELIINKGFARKTMMEESKSKVGAGFQGAPSARKESVTIRMVPYGVFGVIAPFNFPVSISTGMSSGAMITGNTVVFKPSSTDNMTMLTGLKIYECFKEAGIPDGVFNYITGPGSEIGDELVVNKDVAGIAFTGSRTIGLGMMVKAYGANTPKAFIVEMGGKNPAIVSRYADMDDAVTGVASAAFGFDGQKCSACSRVYVHESIKEQFISKLIEKARGFKIGNPLEKDVYIGPLIGEKAYATYKDAVERAKASGRVLYGGKIVNTGLNGYYVEPTIIEVRSDNELMKKELFVPILAVQGYKEFADAITEANSIEYGLTAGLYSKNTKEIRAFESAIEAGTAYINRDTSATTGAIVGLHTFVGWKGSSIGGKGSGSKYYLPQFMREQSMSLTK